MPKWRRAISRSQEEFAEVFVGEEVVGVQADRLPELSDAASQVT